MPPPSRFKSCQNEGAPHPPQPPHLPHAAPAACRACCRMLPPPLPQKQLPAAKKRLTYLLPAYGTPPSHSPPPRRLQFDRFRLSLLGGALTNSQYFLGCLGCCYDWPTAVMALPWYVRVTEPYVWGACACPVSKASSRWFERENESAVKFQVAAT